MNNKQTNKGIVLLAFGRPGYAKSAYNLALSIKYHSPNIPIHLWIDESIQKHIFNYQFFDKVSLLPNEIIYENGKLNPGSVKVNMYDFLEFDENLYLDVDALCLKDINKLLESLSSSEKDYQVEVTGIGSFEQENIAYNLWAKNIDKWDFFSLSNEDLCPTIQSSFAYIRKSKESKKIFDLTNKLWYKGFPVDKLKITWGGTLPDELIFSGALAKLKYNADSDERPIYFSTKDNLLEFLDITSRYYFLSLWGGGGSGRLVKLKYLEWYDRLMHKYSKHFGLDHIFKQNQIMEDKHVNFS